jgi:hypothetical protein
MGESSKQRRVELDRQVQVVKQVSRLNTPRSDFDRKAQAGGLIVSVAEFGRIQLVKRQIIGNLHYTNFERRRSV